MRVYLVRHPEPISATGLCYGRTDLAVAEEAVDAVAERVNLIVGHPLTHCFSSPLSRCLSLARRLCPDVRVDDRLVELDFGLWEGRLWEDLDRDEFEDWAENYVNQRVPGGESWEDVRQRAVSFLADLRTWDVDGVAVVTHSGVIRAVLAQVLGIALEPTWHIHIPFGCIITIDLGASTTDDHLVALAE